MLRGIRIQSAEFFFMTLPNIFLRIVTAASALHCHIPADPHFSILVPIAALLRTTSALIHLTAMSLARYPSVTGTQVVPES
jgi:hypothetical protein